MESIGAVPDDLVKRVLDAASSVFGREVRPTDDFFSLGGDSLTAVQLVFLLEEAVEIEMDAELVLSAADFAALAAALAARLPKADRA